VFKVVKKSHLKVTLSFVSLLVFSRRRDQSYRSGQLPMAIFEVWTALVGPVARDSHLYILCSPQTSKDRWHNPGLTERVSRLGPLLLPALTSVGSSLLNRVERGTRSSIPRSPYCIHVKPIVDQSLRSVPNLNARSMKSKRGLDVDFSSIIRLIKTMR
jgi:hypothetical protein